MRIVADDLTHPDVRALLEHHFAAMLANSPPGSCHFLDFAGLSGPDVSLWSIWDDDRLAGLGALKALSPVHGEIKSMRTAADYQRQGVAGVLLAHIVGQARSRGYLRVSLETGTGAAFDAAHALYRRFGFAPCPPFGDYGENPHSRFMTMAL